MGSSSILRDNLSRIISLIIDKDYKLDKELMKEFTNLEDANFAGLDVDLLVNFHFSVGKTYFISTQWMKMNSHLETILHKFQETIPNKDLIEVYMNDTVSQR